MEEGKRGGGGGVGEGEEETKRKRQNYPLPISCLRPLHSLPIRDLQNNKINVREDKLGGYMD